LAGLGTVAVVDDEFGVDRTTIDRLRAQGVRVLVCCPEEQVRRYDALGAMGLARDVPVLPAIHAACGGIVDAQLVVEALSTPPQPESGAASHDDEDTRQGQHRLGDGAATAAVTTRAQDPSAAADGAHAASRPREPARVLAVTGAPGAPGRITLAINIAD